MLLAIDIGNTDFTIGIFQEKKLCDTFRMRTKINRTSDEYGVLSTHSPANAFTGSCSTNKNTSSHPAILFHNFVFFILSLL